jgi:hypothetical protein
MISVTPSKEFEEFLNFLGERITLNGWTGFRGGLDVKSESFLSLLIQPRQFFKKNDAFHNDQYHQ